MYVPGRRYLVPKVTVYKYVFRDAMLWLFASQVPPVLPILQPLYALQKP